MKRLTDAQKRAVEAMQLGEAEKCDFPWCHKWIVAPDDGERHDEVAFCIPYKTMDALLRRGLVQVEKRTCWERARLVKEV